jgi:hypothetical protein
VFVRRVLTKRWIRSPSLVSSTSRDLELRPTSRASRASVSGRAAPVLDPRHRDSSSRCVRRYVGEFGKIQIDELCQYHNMLPSDYTAVRVGMAVTESIISGRIDCGIGLENVQVVELEQWCLAQGRPITDVCLLSIADLAELGCCCFCTIRESNHLKSVEHETNEGE